MSAVHSQELPWRQPWTVAKALATHFGTDGLAWLDGDGSPLGATAFLGADPCEVVICRGLPGSPGARDPFLALDDLQRRGGAWLGWLAYEAGAWVEETSGPWHPPELPTLWAARYNPLLRFDLPRRRLWLEGDDPAPLSVWADLVAGLDPQQVLPDPPGQPIDPALWHWHTSAAAFAAQVEQLLERIAAGDLFQANLSACCEVLLPEPPDPLALYQRLRQHCPAPFGGLVVAGASAVLSASPERFLRLSAAGRVETRPIKGTRPRHGDADADAAAAAELITDPKDRAENVMIVDLLRNDLGRVCVPGSIQVPQLVGLESYRQVHHLTSVVEGQLRADRTVVDLLRACWPGGSISGAPKIRACQRLGELEPVARGPYCGSLFRLGPEGSFDSNILIRSVMLQGRRLRAHAGCGIVADSNPAGEAEELGWKLRPLLEALA